MIKTIFISSTFEDLKQYRAKVWDSLQNIDVTIRGMERFGARKENSLTTCLNECEISDIYIGIIGMRYGSIDEASGKSYTMLEYEKALERNKDILFFLIDEKNAKVSPDQVDTDDRSHKLISFKEIVRERHTVAYFTNENDLALKITLSLDGKVSSKSEKAAEIFTDNFARSLDTIQKFLLMPNAYSGKTVELKCKVLGQPFPASKVVCNNFNLSYGKTAGINVEVLQPKVENFTRYLFIEHDCFEKFPMGKDIEVTIKAVLKFSDDVINTFKARFVREEYVSFDTDFTKLTSALSSFELFPRQRTVVHEAEGTVILQFTDIVATSRHKTPAAIESRQK